MLAQLRAGDDATLIAQGEAQRDRLAGLQRSLASAGPANLAAIRSAIAPAVSASTSLTQQVRGLTAQSEAAELAAARDESRQQVQALMRDMHRFDPYLRFASSEEEAEYRRREADRRAYIEEQQARGTPEGDLNASGAAIGQMVDAQAHGAADSPEFRQRWDELAGTTARLRDAVRAAGGSTREADDLLECDVRQSLRRRGRTDAEIDMLFAGQNDDALKVMQAEMAPSSERALHGSPEGAARVAGNEASQQSDLQDAMAALRAAGVVAPTTPVGVEAAPGTPQLAQRGTSLGRR